MTETLDAIARATESLITVPYNGVPVLVKVRELTEAQIQQATQRALSSQKP